MRGRRDAKNNQLFLLIKTLKFNIFQFSKILNTPSLFFNTLKTLDGKVIQQISKKIIEPRIPFEMSHFFDGTKSWLVLVLFVEQVLLHVQ